MHHKFQYLVARGQNLKLYQAWHPAEHFNNFKISIYKKVHIERLKWYRFQSEFTEKIFFSYTFMLSVLLKLLVLEKPLNVNGLGISLHNKLPLLVTKEFYTSLRYFHY